MLTLLTLFLLGALYDIITTIDILGITENKPTVTAIATFTGVLIWFIAIRIYVEQIDNLSLALAYALGSAVGSYLTVDYYRARRK